MKKWKDISSYSQNDKERIPTIWELRIGHLRVVVHRHRWEEPDKWFMSVHGDIDIDKLPLHQKDLEKAQKEALATLHSSLHRMCKEVAAVMYK